MKGKMMYKGRPLKIALLIIKELKDPYFQGFAAQIAFYFLLSIVPMLILLSQILTLFSLSFDAIGQLVEQYASTEIAEMIKDFISFTPTGTMNLVFVLVSLWAASKAQFFLGKIANYSITGEPTGRGYFRERLRAIQTIVLTLFTLVFSLIIIVYGELLIKIVLDALLELFNIKYTVGDFWYIIRWPIAMVLYFVTVTYNYYVLPTQKVRIREILPGSIFSAISILVVTSIYSAYANSIASYSLLYGSLASIVAIMMWFYILGWTLGLGVMLNKAWRETAISTPELK